MAMATSTMANLTVMIALLIAAATAASNAPAPAPVTGYTNHTVGGTVGWFFNSTTNTSATNYSTWAATQTFNLGDYLSKQLKHFISFLRTKTMSFSLSFPCFHFLSIQTTFFF